MVAYPVLRLGFASQVKGASSTEADDDDDDGWSFHLQQFIFIGMLMVQEIRRRTASKNVWPRPLQHQYYYHHQLMMIRVRLRPSRVMRVQMLVLLSTGTAAAAAAMCRLCSYKSDRSDIRCTSVTVNAQELHFCFCYTSTPILYHKDRHIRGGCLHCNALNSIKSPAIC